LSQDSTIAGKKLNGRIIIDELIRNTELGQFELTYTVLLPCVFSVYLNPEDHAHLSGVFHLVANDARRALRAHVARLNGKPAKSLFSTKPAAREFRIASQDWTLEFLPDSEVPPGDVEIHSELTENAEPGYRGVKTTLTGRDPSVTSRRAAIQAAPAADGPRPLFQRRRFP
jgi:hypothetical protein